MASLVERQTSETPHCLRLLDSPSFILPSAISVLVHVKVKAFRPYEGCGLVMENLDMFGLVRMYVHLACVYTGVGMCVCKYIWHKYMLRWVFMSVNTWHECVLEWVCMSMCTLGMSMYWGGGGVLGRPTPLSVIKHIATLSELGQLNCLYCSKLKQKLRGKSLSLTPIPSCKT